MTTLSVIKSISSHNGDTLINLRVTNDGNSAASFYMYAGELNDMINHYHSTATDGYYTMRILSNSRLILWKWENTVLDISADVPRLLNVIATLPSNGKEIALNLSKFSKKWYEVEPPPLTWCEIMRHSGFLSSAKKTLAQILREPTINKPEALPGLQREISSVLLRNGKISSDCWPYGFYFTYPTGGDGGIIFHKNSQSYSIHT